MKVMDATKVQNPLSKIYIYLNPMIIMRVILITGFPHSGTTIMQKILAKSKQIELFSGKDESKIEIVGEMDNRYFTHKIRELYQKQRDDIEYAEIMDLKEPTYPDFVLAKDPMFHKLFLEGDYKDYIKIFMIRNPIFVFSSLNKRFDYDIPAEQGVQKYIDTVQSFNDLRENPIENVYTIRYEDCFEKNFENLTNILKGIGIETNDAIFEIGEMKGDSEDNKVIPSSMREGLEHTEYRTWQINQPFRNMNDYNKLDLKWEQINHLLDNQEVLKAYPELVEMMDRTLHGEVNIRA